MEKKKFLEINGDYLEGGGQILRTAVAFSLLSRRPVRIFNIRHNRPQPGLKNQHLFILDALREIWHAQLKGLKLGSEEIEFIPSEEIIGPTHIEIDMASSASIGLFLQGFLLAAAFRSKGLSLNIKGGTCGLGAIPVDYYKAVIFPLLFKSGLRAKLQILRRGYYPKGGGEVVVEIAPLRHPKAIKLTNPGEIKKIYGLSIASRQLINRRVAQRQAEEAKRLLKQTFSCPVEIEAQYVDTYSIASEINLYAYTSTDCILGSDSRGELKRSAEEVAQEAYLKLKKEISAGAACDMHLADNLVPWLCLLGGEIKTSEISQHTRTNIWVSEQFFGKIFKIEGNQISVERALDLSKV